VIDIVDPLDLLDDRPRRPQGSADRAASTFVELIADGVLGTAEISGGR
jgi:hypothetical protein